MSVAELIDVMMGMTSFPFRHLAKMPWGSIKKIQLSHGKIKASLNGRGRKSDG